MLFIYLSTPHLFCYLLKLLLPRFTLIRSCLFHFPFILLCFVSGMIAEMLVHSKAGFCLLQKRKENLDDSTLLSPNGSITVALALTMA